MQHLTKPSNYVPAQAGQTQLDLPSIGSADLTARACVSGAESVKAIALLGRKTDTTSPCRDLTKKSVTYGQGKALASEASTTAGVDKVRALRAERYQLGAISRGILASAGARENLPFILNYHRTCKCMYIPFRDTVDLYMSKEHKKAFAAGFVACASVWDCPVCTAKIQERRRIEISTAMDHIYGNMINKQCAMITLTFSHSYGDKLQDLLDAQKIALNKLRSGKAWVAFKEAFGFGGLIRSKELTFGDSGYHPHTHELWVCDNKFNRERIESYVNNKFRYRKHWARRDELLAMESEEIMRELIVDRWFDCCKKAGLMDGVSESDFRRYSVDIKFNCSNSDYLQKMDDSKNWGVDREMAKASTKEGRKSGMHPFAFLTHFDNAADKKTQSLWASRWIEYCKATKGNQIFWSRGLKDECLVDDLTDEEIIEKQEDEADKIYSANRVEIRKLRLDMPTVFNAVEDTDGVAPGERTQIIRKTIDDICVDDIVQKLRDRQSIESRSSKNHPEIMDFDDGCDVVPITNELPSWMLAISAATFEKLIKHLAEKGGDDGD